MTTPKKPIICGERIEAGQFVHIGVDGKAYGVRVPPRAENAEEVARANELAQLLRGFSVVDSVGANWYESQESESDDDNA